MKKIIRIIDEITNYTARNVLDSIIEIIESGYTDEIIVLINSPGGNINAELSILDIFDSIPNKIITVNIGVAESCAGTIFIHGDKRYMAKNAKFLFHSPLLSISSIDSMPPKDFQKALQELNKTTKQLKKFLSSRTNIPKKLIKKGISMSSGVTLSANDCIKYGVADEILTDLAEVIS